nr:MAG TPA: putative cytoplasmic protein [Bacteriophage sp.]
MKKECLICNEMFEALNGAKFCPECRAEGRRICTRCGAVFIVKGRTRTCNACNTACMREGKKEYAPRENVERYVPKDQKMLDEKAAAARKAGLSYGKYVAVQRGLLKV